MARNLAKFLYSAPTAVVMIYTLCKPTVLHYTQERYYFLIGTIQSPSVHSTSKWFFFYYCYLIIIRLTKYVVFKINLFNVQRL